MVNLGCGIRVHPDWVNFDMVSKSSGVIVTDLVRGIPLDDQVAEVVFHSHLIEHLDRAQAGFLTSECFRILKPGGHIRVATPDLETIARLYIEKLESLGRGEGVIEKKYDWLVIELLDQQVRNRSGGEMIAFIKEHNKNIGNFLKSRIGNEMETILAANETDGFQKIPKHREYFPKRVLRFLSNIPDRIRLKFLKALMTGREMEAFQKGIFRISGEMHLWLYDSFSLSRLLTQAGFSQVARKEAGQSQINDWKNYNLEIDPYGDIIKPDSIFIEAIRSGQ
jgi:hypothetical protein